MSERWNIAGVAPWSIGLLLAGCFDPAPEDYRPADPNAARPEIELTLRPTKGTAFLSEKVQLELQVRVKQEGNTYGHLQIGWEPVALSGAGLYDVSSGFEGFLDLGDEADGEWKTRWELGDEVSQGLFELTCKSPGQHLIEANARVDFVTVDTDAQVTCVDKEACDVGLELLGDVCRFLQPLVPGLVVHSSPDVMPQQSAGDHTEMTGSVVGVVTASASALSELASRALLWEPLGDPAQEGEMVLMAFQLASAIPFPIPGPNNVCQIGHVIDADGQASNNYDAAPAFANDYFRGADRMFVTTYDAATGFAVDAWDAALASVPSDAIIFIVHDVAGVLIPRSSVTASTLRYRQSIFCSDGSYGLSGGSWAGYTNPVADLPPLEVTLD